MSDVMEKERRERTTQQSNGHGKDHSAEHGMRPLAEKIQQHHTQPAPESAEPAIEPFPAVLWMGTAAGLIVGALFGLLFGWLLFSGTIAPQGWEAIFSLGPFTFHVFWALLGAALGLLAGGIGAIVTTRPS